MDPSGIVIGAVGLVMAGPVIYLVTRQASRGAIDVNSAIGIRTRTTKSSQETWEVAHRAALPWVSVAGLLALASAIISLTALVLANTVGASEVAPVVVLIGGYLGLLVLMSIATSVGNHAVRRSVGGYSTGTETSSKESEE